MIDINDIYSTKSINKENDNDKVLLKFVTMNEELICSYEYPLETYSNQAIEDFLKKNNENSLKSFFNFGNNFNIHNLSFYTKIDGNFQRLDISNNFFKDRKFRRYSHVSW